MPQSWFDAQAPKAAPAPSKSFFDEPVATPVVSAPPAPAPPPARSTGFLAGIQKALNVGADVVVPTMLAQMGVGKREPGVEPSWFEKVADTVVPAAWGVGGAIAGGIVGGLPGAGAGSGVGNIVGQSYEKARGIRDEVKLAPAAVATVGGALPVVKAGATVAQRVLSRAAQNAGIGGGTYAASELSEGRTPSVGGTLVAGGVSGALGAAAGRAESRTIANIAAREAAEKAHTATHPTLGALPPSKASFFGIDESALGTHSPVTMPDPKGVARSAAELAPAAPPAQAGAQAARIAGEETVASEPVVPAGQIGPHEGLAPDQLLEMVKTGQKPAMSVASKLTAPELRSSAEKLGLTVRDDGVNVIVAKDPETAEALATAFQKQDHVAAGRLLGYTEDDIQTFTARQPVASHAPKPTPRPAPTATPPLPRDLAGAKPRYGYKDQNFEVEFENPMDLAAYILAQRNPSKRDGDYLAYVMKHTGLDEAGARAMGVAVRGRVKTLAQSSQDGGPLRVSAMAAPRQPSVSSAPVVPPTQTGGGTPPPPVPPPGVAAAAAGATPAPPIPGATAKPVQAASVRAERIGATLGEPIPPTIKDFPKGRPLPKARIDGDAVFVSKQAPEHQAGIAEVIEENKHYAPQRRGVQSHERTHALAPYIEVEYRKHLPKGTTFNAEEFAAHKGHIDAVSERMEEISERIRTNGATPEDQISLIHATTQRAVLLANALGARAETGRALNILGELSRAMKTRDVAAYEKIIKAAKQGGFDPVQMATDFANLTDDAARMRYLRALSPAGKMDWAKGIFFSNILSGPRTHLRNVIGNTTNAAFRAVSQGAAYGVDVVKSAATGKPREIYAGELKHRLAGTMVGIYEGFDDFRFALRNGYTRTQLGTFDVARKELQGGGANPLNWTGRLLEAEDQFFYGMNYHAELYARLFAAAKKMGLKGKALTDQVADWKLSPPKAIHEAANKEALMSTYKEDGGKIVQWLTAGKTKLAALDFIIPFVKTPGNLMRQGLEATPLGVFTHVGREAMAAGGRESSEALGRMITGTAALGTLAWWAAAGNISGVGPSDPEERAALMEAGWRPNSIKIGDKWIGFDVIQPLAQPLFAVANAIDRYHRGEQVDPLRVAMAGGSALLDQSFLSGVSDLNRAFADNDRYGDQFMQRYVQSAVPFSGLSRNITQAIDPAVREPKTYTDAVKAIVPGLSTEVPAKIGRVGQTIEREGNPIRRGLSPVNYSSPPTDPVIQELTRLKINTLSVPRKDLPATQSSPKIVLTTDERQQIGKATRTGLERLFSNPNFKQLDETAATRLVNQIVETARSQAYQQIRQARQGGG